VRSQLAFQGRRAFGNPREIVDVNFNRPDVLAVEIPAGNGIGEARAGAAAHGAGRDRRARLERRDAGRARPPCRGAERRPRRFRLACADRLLLGQREADAGIPLRELGERRLRHSCNGGSFGFADPDTGVGYCYAPNRLGFGLVDEREVPLRDALYREVLGERPQRPT
jgi:hypothetical protein